MKSIVLIALLGLLCIGANAIAIKWTGYGGDNQWTNRLNWAPDQVPTTNDDVTIDSGVVIITPPAGCNSIVMGTRVAATANVTFYNSFFIGTGGLEVDLNGFIFINSGAANVATSGTVTMGGYMYFQSGQISGQWNIANRAVLDMSGPAQKVLSGASLNVAGSFVLSGVLAMNQSSVLTVTSAATLSKDISIQAQDTTSVLFDTSKGSLTYNGGGTFQIQAPVQFGTFNFVGGNLSIYSSMSFANAFVIPTGSVVSAVGAAVVSMAAGVSGSGILNAQGTSLILGNTNLTGPFNLIGGNVSIQGSTANFALFTITGGIGIFSTRAVINQFNLMNGILMGSGGVQCNQLYFNSQGLNLMTSIAIVTSGTNLSPSKFVFNSGASIHIRSGARYNAQGRLTFVGSSGTVTNDGTLNVASDVTFQNINLQGAGSVTAAATLAINVASISQNRVTLSGSGTLKGSTSIIGSINAVACSPSVHAVFGSYSVTCEKECDSVSTATLPSSAFSFTCGSSRRVQLL